MKKFTLIIILTCLCLTSCASRKRTQTITNTKVLGDTLIRHTSRSVVLPQKNVVILDRPCKENALAIANQKITNEKSTINIDNIDGSLRVSVDIDSIVSSRLAEYDNKVHMERIEVPVEVEVPVRNRLNGYLLIYSISASLWIFRKPIIGLVRRLIIPI